jgi:MscS family membrane protein
MVESLPETLRLPTNLILGLSILASLATVVGLIYLPRLLGNLLIQFLPPKIQEIYTKIFAPYQLRLGLVLLLSTLDLVILLNPTSQWLNWLEIPLGLAIALGVSWLGSQIFRQFFDVYLLDAAMQSKHKVNSEVLIVAKLVANTTIILIVMFVFAQVHAINLLGLLASLGVGGLAIAFAAQKTLEQLLGGIVLFIDRPFVVDDYIGLSDGTFGRVETIGLRSTKIRTSGKGTLVIVPNNALTQANIENYTGAKKIISLLYLNFHQHLPIEEKALIRQIILASTNDIFGIDPRSTDVIFKDIREQNQEITQAQINFFILGSGKVSMDLRRQLLDIASQSITRQLKEYGIAFDLNEQVINIDSPITI